MTIGEFQKQALEKLQKSGTGSANLDVLILLEDALGKDRAWILAHPEYVLKNTTPKELEAKLNRREKHEPLAYIRGKTEFYGREFYVNKHVLEPRPESETMITLLKNLLHHKIPYPKDRPLGTLDVVDVGTGSGTLAITAKMEMSVLDVSAVDIDPNCLEVASKNIKNHKVKIQLFEGDLLIPLISSNFDFRSSIILANLPYVPDDFTINQAAAMEPRIAIFGGPDGLDVYRRLFGQLDELKLRSKYIFTESLPPQHTKLSKIAQKAGYKLTKTEDFIQIFESKQ
jgi:release factor glutamine methyltransferase